MDREPSTGAKTPTVLRKRLQRMLAFVWAVMRHGWALLATLLGSFVLSIPSWIDPLLSTDHAREFTSALTISPHSYRDLAIGFFGVGLLYACFLAWNEERDQIENLIAEKAKREAEKENPLSMLFGDAAAQREHAAALERHTSQLRRDSMERFSRSLLPKDTEPKPRAILRWEYKNSILSIVATNQGVLGEFYGIFDVDGFVKAKRQTELFCKWSHSDSVRTKIAKGDSRRIDLAELKFDGMTHTWEIFTSSETEPPTAIPASYSSVAISTTVTKAPDIMIRGRLVAEPDSANGVQPFRFVLQAFGVIEGEETHV
jgi:hypothetical protein